MCFKHIFDGYRVDVGLEDDLSPESGSDGMEIDDPPPVSGGAQGNTNNISGALLPDILTQFHVSNLSL